MAETERGARSKLHAQSGAKEGLSRDLGLYRHTLHDDTLAFQLTTAVETPRVVPNLI